MLDVLEALQREVEKVAAAAGGVEDAEMFQPFEKADVEAVSFLERGGGPGFLGGLARVLKPVKHLHVFGDFRLDIAPFCQQRLDNDRIDDAHDRAGVGIVRAGLAALGRVEAAFEQGAEDGRFDGAPVERCDVDDLLDVVLVERNHHVVVEQAAVEPLDDVLAKFTVRLGHGGEQVDQLLFETFGILEAVAQNFREQSIRQQRFAADTYGALGKHAEENFIQKVRDFVWLVAALLEHQRQIAEQFRRLFGDGGARALRLEAIRFGEEPQQLLPVGGLANVLERDGVRLARRTGEVGVDFNVHPVAHHQQRRVVERQCVTHQLLECRLQSGSWGLVFPGEMAALPHVRPAAARAGALGAALEAVVVVFVRVAGLVDAEQFTEIEEVKLRTGALGEGVVLPLCDELFGGQACSERSRC